MPIVQVVTRTAIANCSSLASEYKIMSQDFILLVPFRNYTIDDFPFHHQRRQQMYPLPALRQDMCRVAERQRADHGAQRWNADHHVLWKIHERRDLHQLANAWTAPTGSLVEKLTSRKSGPPSRTKTNTSLSRRLPQCAWAGEELGFDPGSRSTGKMVAALKRLGLFWFRDGHGFYRRFDDHSPHRNC